MAENRAGLPEQNSSDREPNETVQSSQPEVHQVGSGAKCDIVAELDSLGFQPYVNGIARFLTDETTEAPLTISIEGEWGSGKTSFMKQLEKALSDQMQASGRKAITFWFSPWLHDKEESLWAAFALEFIESLRRRLNWGKRMLAGLKLVRLRFDWTSGRLDVVRILLSACCFILLLLALVALFLLNP